MRRYMGRVALERVLDHAAEREKSAARRMADSEWRMWTHLSDMIRSDAVAYGWRLEDVQVAALLDRIARRHRVLICAEDHARRIGDGARAQRIHAEAVACYDAHEYASAFVEELEDEPAAHAEALP